MRVPVVLGLLMVLSILLSGCTGGDDAAPAPAPADDPILHTSPDDVVDADANRSHLHDYWNGQTELAVFDEEFRIQCICGTAAPFFRHEPPAEAFFPQGTRWVNITVDWETTQDSYFSDTSLWVETAADREPQEVGPIANGDTITFEVTDNTQNDLPHEILSNWAFEIRVGEGVPALGLWRVEGTARLSATAARGLELPLFPPHPDRWEGQTEILLFEDDDNANPIYIGNPETGQTGNSWLGPHMPDDGTIAPHDMDRVEVTVTYHDDAPVPFTLAFHGGESRSWTLVEPVSTDGNVAHYVITPDQGRPDGPYLEQSNWVFEVYADDDDTPFFLGGYDITATVHKDPA